MSIQELNQEFLNRVENGILGFQNEASIIDAAFAAAVNPMADKDDLQKLVGELSTISPLSPKHAEAQKALAAVTAKLPVASLADTLLEAKRNSAQAANYGALADAVFTTEERRQFDAIKDDAQYATVSLSDDTLGQPSSVSGDKVKKAALLLSAMANDDPAKKKKIEEEVSMLLFKHKDGPQTTEDWKVWGEAQKESATIISEKLNAQSPGNQTQLKQRLEEQNQSIDDRVKLGQQEVLSKTDASVKPPTKEEKQALDLKTQQGAQKLKREAMTAGLEEGEVIQAPAVKKDVEIQPSVTKENIENSQSQNQEVVVPPVPRQRPAFVGNIR